MILNYAETYGVQTALEVTDKEKQRTQNIVWKSGINRVENRHFFFLIR